MPVASGAEGQSPSNTDLSDLMLQNRINSSTRVRQLARLQEVVNGHQKPLVQVDEHHHSVLQRVETTLSGDTFEISNAINEDKSVAIWGHIYARITDLKNLVKGGQEVTIYYTEVSNGLTNTICHHFAFGGLNDGADDFDVNNIIAKMGRDKTDAEVEEEAELYGLSADEYRESEIFSPKHNSLATLAENNVKDSLEREEETEQANLRVYGTAHSARTLYGNVWHKFNGVPAIIAVNGVQDIGIGGGANLNIRALKIKDGALTTSGSFRVKIKPEED